MKTKEMSYKDLGDRLVKAVERLGLNDAATSMGAIEGHAVKTEAAGALVEHGLFYLADKQMEGVDKVSDSLDGIAHAVHDLAEAIRSVTFVFEKRFGCQPEEET